MARTEQDKFIQERAVFVKFLSLLKENYTEADISKGDPNHGEPDIIYKSGNVLRYFELAESCAPEFAEAEFLASKSEDGVYAAFGGDGIEEVLKKKLSKVYRALGQVELILYNDGRNGLPDQVVLDKARYVIKNGIGPFGKIWFLSDDLYVV